MLSKNQLKQILKENNIRPNKRQGQNFLVDESVAEDILHCAGLNQQDCVLEIGAGLGALTKRLSHRVKKIIALEKDRRLFGVLKKRCAAYKNLTLLCADILKFDLSRVGSNFKIVANLPYYITTPIIEKILSQRQYFKLAVLTLQKELAERIAANPGSKRYGRISCLVQYYAHVSIYRKVKAHAFYPAPEVDSAVVRFKILENPAVCVDDEKRFFLLIKYAFSQRRKNILNSLVAGVGLNKDALAEVFEQAGIDPQCRAETLSLPEFASLANLLKDSLS